MMVIPKLIFHLEEDDELVMDKQMLFDLMVLLGNYIPKILNRGKEPYND